MMRDDERTRDYKQRRRVARSRRAVRALLDAAQAAGMTVLRTWAYSVNAAFPLQLAPGVYDDTYFRGLDYVIAQAGARGMRHAPLGRTHRPRPPPFPLPYPRPCSLPFPFFPFFPFF